MNSAKLGLWNWLFEPGPVGVQGNILAPLLTFGEHPRVLSVNCLTQHVERADCSWVPWGDQQLTALEAVVLEFLARFFRNTSKLFSLEGVSASELSCILIFFSFKNPESGAFMLDRAVRRKTVQRISIPLIHVRVFKARVRSLLLFCFSQHRTSLK